MLKAILNLLDNDVAVEEIVSDFERAVWRSFHATLPNGKVTGCAFYWTQAKFWNLKKLGLIRDYCNKPAVKVLCHRVMSLHLIPHSEIPKEILKSLKKLLFIHLPLQPLFS